jgi:hypothetical protein
VNINETSVTDGNKLVLFAASFLAMPSQKSSRFRQRNVVIASHNSHASRANSFYESAARPTQDFDAFWLGFGQSAKAREATLNTLCAVHQRRENRAA